MRRAGLAVFPYRSDQLVLVTNQGHPLAAAKSVALADCMDYDFIPVLFTSLDLK